MSPQGSHLQIKTSLRERAGGRDAADPGAEPTPPDPARSSVCAPSGRWHRAGPDGDLGSAAGTGPAPSFSPLSRAPEGNPSPATCSALPTLHPSSRTLLPNFVSGYLSL